MRLEPTVLPSTVMSEPLAWDGKATWATAVTASGYSDAGDEGEDDQQPDGRAELPWRDGMLVIVGWS